jgi:hypothetical protein
VDELTILLFDQVLTPVTGRAVAIVRFGVIKGIVLSGNPRRSRFRAGANGFEPTVRPKSVK